MAHTSSPFAVTGPVDGRIDAVLSYWQNLRRGSAEMPFWDDVSLPDVNGACADVFLIDVFARPERFRIAELELAMPERDRDAILGRFIDEVDLPHPFEQLRAQCAATVESMRPSVHVQDPALAGEDGYQRLLLPLWGEGQVRMLLGAIARR